MQESNNRLKEIRKFKSVETSCNKKFSAQDFPNPK